MDFKDFQTGINDENRRLDKVLRNFLDTSHLSEIYKLIRKGLIKVNKKKSSPDYRIVSGDVISIAAFLFSDQRDSKPSPTTANLPLLQIEFENPHILIINKPYDINVHGDDNSLDKAVTAYYNSKYENDSLSFAPGPLHRLDRKTTGLLAFSLSLEGARWFTENIQNHSISKKYYALVQGTVKTQEEYKDFITYNENKTGFATVKASSKSTDENDKEAVSVVTPLAFGHYKNEPVTFLKVEIKTGRKHQIRSQCALHNHPLLGDTAYGGIKITESRDFYLQAYELNIPQNPVGLPPLVKINLENDFMNVLKDCGIKNIAV